MDCSFLEDLLVLKTTEEGLRRLESLQIDADSHWRTVSGHRYRCAFAEASLAMNHIATILAAKMDSWLIMHVEERLYESKLLRVLELQVLRPAKLPQWIAPGEKFDSFCGQVTVHCSDR